MLEGVDYQMQNSWSLPKPQSHPSLTRQTYNIIQRAILELEFKPGERLSIERLSKQLDVSRTPVKEALLQLEQDGLVHIVPQSGTFVSDITAKDVDEILELRILLEGHAAGQAAQLLSEAEIANAEAILGRMKESLNENRHVETETIGHEFHQLVLSKLTNERLRDFLQVLDIQYARIRHYMAHLIHRQSISLDEHYQILSALKARDSDQATAAMVKHLSSVRDDMLSALNSRSKDNNTPVKLSTIAQEAPSKSGPLAGQFTPD